MDRLYTAVDSTGGIVWTVCILLWIVLLVLYGPFVYCCG
jgi:hypothetical protein